MSYADKVKYSKIYIAANEDSDIKNKRFNKEMKIIKKDAKMIVKYLKPESVLSNPLKNSLLAAYKEDYKNQTNKLSTWLHAKVRAIPYGSQYHQSEDERVVYHKDYKWATKKIEVLNEFMKKTNELIKTYEQKTLAPVEEEGLTKTK